MTSVDELVRRIITVMNSNDPVARALTLRTLGRTVFLLVIKAAMALTLRTLGRTVFLTLLLGIKTARDVTCRLHLSLLLLFATLPTFLYSSQIASL